MANKEWTGTHIVEPKENDIQSIMTPYRIWGVPRYILIDKMGMIVKVDAPPPSSGDVIVKEIQDVLSKNSFTTGKG